MKLFVDSNSLISGLLYPGNERLLLVLGRYGTCDLVAVDYVRDEIEDYLGRSKVGLSNEERRRLMAILDRSVTFRADPPVAAIRQARGRIRDEEDLPVLAGFEASDADYLVTGDRDLRQSTSKGITTRRALELLLGKFDEV